MILFKDVTKDTKPANTFFPPFSFQSSFCPIKTLNIGQNDISTAGMLAMKSALINNRSLQQLGVQAAQIDSEGILVIAEALEKNSCIQRIDVRSNAIGTKGLTVLKKILNDGSTVHRIDLDDSQENPEDQKLIDDIRECCRLNEARFRVKEELENSKSFFCSRKISLTCETFMRHQLESGKTGDLLGEPKRSGRLRSPEPSPLPSPASSPLPSPSRNRFRVSRVSESSSSGSSSISPSSPVTSSRFRVTVVEPSTVHADNNSPQIGFKIPTPPPPVEEPQIAEKRLVDSGCCVVGEKGKKPPEIQIQEPSNVRQTVDEEDCRKRKVSVFPTAPQIGLEKLMGIFQKPTSIFNSLPGDKKQENVGPPQRPDTNFSAEGDKTNCPDDGNDVNVGVGDDDCWEWNWSTDKENSKSSAETEMKKEIFFNKRSRVGITVKSKKDI